MKYSKYKSIFGAVLIALTLLGITEVSAQTTSKQKSLRVKSSTSAPKVTTEFGLGVGARYNWFEVQPVSSVFTPHITMKMSYGAALQFRLNIGKSFGIQPEISYAYSTVRISDNINNFSTKAKFNMVQIPLLLSVRIAMFRINAGPVFTLMDNPTYQLADASNETIKQMPLGKLFPTITYTAGISVKFARCMIIDVRYADQFRDIQSFNSYIWTLDTTKQSDAQTFRTRSRSVQVRIGYVF